jgi:2-hydroxychromene-2-carboxylate isomerase
MSPRSVEFLFDYASPFAYLASETLARKLPGIEIVHKPIYLRGLEMFSKGLPYTAAKAMYVVRDYLRCADHEGVETRIPSVFPINGLYAARGALVAMEQGRFADYHSAMFRAAFREDRNISSKEVVLEVAREASVEIAERLDAIDLKEKLRADTSAAEARGVFGVPSFFVGDELFWGLDRLDFVLRAAL